MNDKPFFSVVIASYNEGDKIIRALDSVKQQSYTNFEVIVVDDGSDEESITVINNYSRDEAWVKVICQDHAGVSAARNKGIDASCGDYLIFLDADDYLREGILGKYSDIICNNDKVDILLPNYTVLKETDLTEKREKFFTSDECLKTSDEKLIHILFDQGVYPGAKGCFDVSIVKGKRIYMREDLVVCEDIDWFLKVLFSSDSVFTVAYDAYVYTLFDKHSIPTYVRYMSQTKASEYWIEEIDKQNISKNSKMLIATFFCRTFSILSLDIIRMSEADREKAFLLCREKIFIANAIRDVKSNLLYYFSKILGVPKSVAFINLLYGKVYKNRAVR